MPGIFVSYRRSDAGGWAHLLFDHLARRVGRAQVFMDVEGGIPLGANFPKTLADALASCGALVAVIGQDWASCAADGQRRILQDDDWVRREIRTAIGRNIPVFQALVGGAPRPAAADLPEDLKLLPDLQLKELTSERWTYDAGELVKAVAEAAHLELVDDVARATGGLNLLRKLIASMPAVAEAVGRSREVIENGARQIRKLKARKNAHDALHDVESRCMLPLAAGGATAPLRPYRLAFADADRRIRAALDEAAIRPELASDLIEALDEVANDFARALARADGEARERLAKHLRALMRRFPSELDRAISDAARELDIPTLVDRLGAVVAPLGSAREDPELAPLRDGIEGLRGLGEELARRVAEHAALQDLDFKLRSVCEGAFSPDPDWKDLERKRQRLPVPAASAELALATPDLHASAADVGAALARGDAREVAALLEAYATGVATAFQSVDVALKDFCLRLATVSEPLDLVLKMCRAPAA